ncbi:MAG: sigma-70 family RNA polymerase sigma factor [Polyangiaceae bacterium]|jgi:RNA polymerase sigma-70 factor (ECF subfamily)|nr:sigma-70 family RNA polymerase sigma factor [Polyangiaceae bacterium]
MLASDALPRVAAELPGGPARSDALPSFDELYDEHVDLVWRALRRFGVGPSELEDATQEVFLVAFRKLDAFEGRCALSTWLYGIAAHVARNLRRSERRHPETPTEDVGLDDASTGASPEDSASDREAARILLELLDTLDDDKREAFVLAELEGLAAPEIAASLGLNVNTVYARIRAGRAAFDQAVKRFSARATSPGHNPDKRAFPWR